ncbi:Hypothetical protein A7982_04131 [Minicystis rosea]|nr:Hypothetical protein A7982_04131 [Minicystis rosea]
MHWLPSRLPFALAIGLGACGGKVVVDGSAGTGGAGGSGGSSSSSSPTVSTSVVSSSSSTSSGPAVCPDPFPGIQASCDHEGLQCVPPLTCCGSPATCKGGLWHYDEIDCDAPCAAPCGPDGFACTAGAVCIAYIGTVTTYQCRENPCQGPLDCSCAGSFCAEQMMSCNNIQMGFKVLCD